MVYALNRLYYLNGLNYLYKFFCFKNSNLQDEFFQSIIIFKSSKKITPIAFNEKGFGFYYHLFRVKDKKRFKKCVNKGFYSKG